jgi:hypothetical protein
VRRYLHGVTNGSNIAERNEDYHAFDERNKRRDNRIYLINRGRDSTTPRGAANLERTT